MNAERCCQATQQEMHTMNRCRCLERLLLSACSLFGTLPLCFKWKPRHYSSGLDPWLNIQSRGSWPRSFFSMCAPCSSSSRSKRPSRSTEQSTRERKWWYHEFLFFPGALNHYYCILDTWAVLRKDGIPKALLFHNCPADVKVCICLLLGQQLESLQGRLFLWAITSGDFTQAREELTNCS